MMAYPYGGYYPQSYYAQKQSLNWVQGEGAAKSYPVGPGDTVVLFDSEAQTIFIKSADMSGMPSLRILDYTIRETPVMALPESGGSPPVYATKEDLAPLSAALEEIRGMLVKEEDHA